MSAMVMPGNDSAYGLPVAGLMEDGPVCAAAAHTSSKS
jgi:hypothetical protein